MNKCDLHGVTDCPECEGNEGGARVPALVGPKSPAPGTHRVLDNVRIDSVSLVGWPLDPRWAVSLVVGDTSSSA